MRKAPRFPEAEHPLLAPGKPRAATGHPAPISSPPRRAWKLDPQTRHPGCELSPPGPLVSSALVGLGPGTSQNWLAVGQVSPHPAPSPQATPPHPAPPLQ